MKQAVRKMGAMVLVVAGLSVVTLAVAKVPLPGRDAGTWDIVDGSGQVIGRVDMDCDGNVYTWGSQAGRYVAISTYTCPRTPF